MTWLSAKEIILIPHASRRILNGNRGGVDVDLVSMSEMFKKAQGA